MRITIAQVNPVVGDLNGNLKRLEQIMEEKAGSTDLLVLPELYLTGYPPLGLLAKEWFRRQTAEQFGRLAKLSANFPQTGILVGAPTPVPLEQGGGWYNTGLLFAGGKLLFTQDKTFLPPYDFFNEASYFRPGVAVKTVNFKGMNLAVLVGEDLWNAALTPPVDLIINLGAYPFYAGWEEKVFRLGAECARRHQTALLMVNQIGGNDEIIFHGESLFFDREGTPRFIAPAFREAVVTVEPGHLPSAALPACRPTGIRAVYEALVLGIRDYARKTGFTKATLGLSGGIDSAVVTCLAAAALGPENVLAISMPSPYSSVGSVEDSRELAKNVGIEFKVLPITPYFQAFQAGLAPYFVSEKTGSDTTEENLQTRIRANLLMAFSNKYGYLVLGAGNKSELAVGYCTLNGVDMTGGLGVLSDLPKTLVYELAAEINREQEVIPAAIITKAPSAELRPGQTDEDTLPPYPILDRILTLYLDENRTPEEIVDQGYAAETVAWVIKTVHRNEYKRRQVVPGLRVTTNPWGRKSRWPVAARFEV